MTPNPQWYRIHINGRSLQALAQDPPVGAAEHVSSPGDGGPNSAVPTGAPAGAPHFSSVTPGEFYTQEES